LINKAYAIDVLPNTQESLWEKVFNVVKTNCLDISEKNVGWRSARLDLSCAEKDG
jgi:hypothetical protein